MPFLRSLLQWLLIPVCTLVLSGGCSLKQATRPGTVRATLSLKGQGRVGATQMSSVPLPNNPNAYFLLIVNGDGIEPSPFQEGACIGLTAFTSYFFSAHFSGEKAVDVLVPAGRNRKITLAFLEFIPGSTTDLLPMDGEDATSFLMRNRSDTKGVFKIASAIIDDLRGDQEVVLNEDPVPEAAQCGGSPEPINMGAITLSHYQPFEGYETPTQERTYSFWLPPYVSGNSLSNYPYVFRFSGEVKNTGTTEITSLNTSFKLVDNNKTPWPQPELSPSPIPGPMPLKAGESTFFRTAFEYSGMIEGQGILTQNFFSGMTDLGGRDLILDARGSSSNPFEILWNGNASGFKNLQSFSITAANQDAILEPLGEDSVFSVFEVKGDTGSDLQLVNPPPRMGGNPCNLAGTRGGGIPTFLKKGESCDFYVAIFKADILDPTSSTSDPIYLEGIGRDASRKDPSAHFQVPLPVETSAAILFDTYGDQLLYDDSRSGDLVISESNGILFSSAFPALWSPNLIRSSLDYGSGGSSHLHNPPGATPSLGSDSNHALTQVSFPRRVSGQLITFANLEVLGKVSSAAGSDQVYQRFRMSLAPLSALQLTLHLQFGLDKPQYPSGQNPISGPCGSTDQIWVDLNAYDPIDQNRARIKVNGNVYGTGNSSLADQDVISVEVNTLDGWIQKGSWTYRCQ